MNQLESLVSSLTPLDGVVHCAGVSKLLPFSLTSAPQLSEVMRLNYEAPVLLTQRLLKRKLINKGGSIVFISSVAGLVGTKGTSIYAGSKGALNSMVRVLALECAHLKIRANCVAPGIVQTPMVSEIESAMSTEAFQEYEKLFPLGFGKPEDVANASVFLLSEAGRWITGTTVVLDGGYTCQ